MELSLREALAAGFVGLLGFLLRSFFSKPAHDIDELKASIAKLDGKIAALVEGLHKETTELAVARQEIRAVWRIIDGAGKRSSDSKGD